MKVSVRDAGLLLLGTGIFILALIALHFYVTEILPELGPRADFSVYCEEVNGQFFAHVDNFGKVPLTDVRVETDRNVACEYGSIPPRSSVICPISPKEPVVRVRTRVAGEEVLRSAVCRRTVSLPMGD